MPAPLRARGREVGDTANAGRLAGTTLTVLRALVTGPHTIASLAELTGQPLRAGYRWVEYLDAAGVPIRQTPTWPVQYHIDALDLMRWLGEPVRPPPKRRRRKRAP